MLTARLMCYLSIGPSQNFCVGEGRRVTLALTNQLACLSLADHPLLASSKNAGITGPIDGDIALDLVGELLGDHLQMVIAHSVNGAFVTARAL